MQLSNHVAVVTGAGGAGSGRAIARRFAREGAAVVAADIDDAAARELARELEEQRLRATAVACDVGDEGQVRELFALAQRTYGRVDFVVNNASALVFPETSFDDSLANLRVDLLGALHVTRHAIEALRSGGGAVVHVSSTSALRHGDPRSHGPGSTGYNTAKAGVLRMTTTLAHLGESEGVRVNCLVPHWIGTEHIKAEIAKMTADERRQWQVPEALISPDEIAAAVLRLATDKTLAGRVLVYHGGSPPKLIPFGDPGYATLEDLPR